MFRWDENIDLLNLFTGPLVKRSYVNNSTYLQEVLQRLNDASGELTSIDLRWNGENLLEMPPATMLPTGL
jgi:hypothetical protein